MRSKNLKPRLLFLIILIFSLSVLFLFSKSTLFGDEIQHYQTIKEFSSLQINHDTFLRDAKLPGYFIAIAAIVRIFNIDSIFGTRIISNILSLLCILIFYLTSREIDKKNSRIKTVEFFFFPVIFIFFFLIYTDIFSLLLLLTSFYFILKKKVMLSSVTGILSVFVRQNNVIWLIFFCFYIARDYNLRKRDEAVRYFKQIFIFILGFLAFAAFISMNKGASIGLTNQMSQPISIHSENIFFFMLLTFLFFLPGIITKLTIFAQKLKQKKYLLFILLLFVLYLTTFKANHFWNSMIFDYYLRNRFLDFILKDSLRKIIFFLPIAISGLYLATVQLNERIKYFFYAFTIIFLAFSWLIDPRYYIIPFTFFLIFKKEESKKVEFITIIIYMLLSIIILFNTLNRSFLI